MKDVVDLRRYLPALVYARRLARERAERLETETFERHQARLARDYASELEELKRELTEIR